MTRSAFTVFSALAVPCDKASGGCGAAIGKRCTAKSGLEMAHCHTSRRKAADAQRTREVQGVDLASGKDRAAIMCLSCYREDCEHVSGVLAKVERSQAKPFFTPSLEPIPPEYYHNVAGRDGIFTIAMKSEAFAKGAQAMKDELETLLNTMAPPTNLSLLPDLDTHSLIPPMRKSLPQRVPDLNSDDTHSAQINIQQGYGLSGQTLPYPKVTPFLFPVGIGVDVRIENAQ